MSRQTAGALALALACLIALALLKDLPAESGTKSVAATAAAQSSPTRVDETTDAVDPIRPVDPAPYRDSGEWKHEQVPVRYSVEFYDVRHVLEPVTMMTAPVRFPSKPTPSSPGGFEEAFDDASEESAQLIKRIKRTIAPGSWDDPQVKIVDKSGTLVVRHRGDVHAAIRKFLDGLSAPRSIDLLEKVQPQATWYQTPHWFLDEIGWDFGSAVHPRLPGHVLQVQVLYDLESQALRRAYAKTRTMPITTPSIRLDPASTHWSHRTTAGVYTDVVLEVKAVHDKYRYVHVVCDGRRFKRKVPIGTALLVFGFPKRPALMGLIELRP